MANIVSCHWKAHVLYFYKPAGTSRGILYQKKSFFLIAQDDQGQYYYGECGLLEGLSIDPLDSYELMLDKVCSSILDDTVTGLNLIPYPSIRCGVEILMKEIQSGENGKIFDNPFYSSQKAIPINGLIWMGDPGFMREQIILKTNNGFRCIKMKVGALDWDIEKSLLKELRTIGGKDLMIRVDANGAWKWDDDIKYKMEYLHQLGIHSIEQPIVVNHLDEMAALSSWSPVDIALDEELFQYQSLKEKAKLLDFVKVPYIVLKPSLVGGFASCDEWIQLCKERNMDYWITSALESNVALNAIAQYTFPHALGRFQGLGTGSLYENNIDAPLEIIGDEIQYNRNKTWDYKLLHS